MAFKPLGVAAKPRPNILAAIFAEIYLNVCSSSNSGIKKCNRGWSNLAMNLITPTSSKIYMIPFQKTAEKTRATAILRPSSGMDKITFAISIKRPVINP